MESSIRKDVIFYLLLTLAILIRFFPHGLTYFPYLDDYIAYGVTHYLLADGEGLFALYFYYGMHTARPLAGLLDVLLVAPLWNYMWLVLLLLALLHAATLPLMNAVFKQIGLPYGRVAAVVFGLYPLLGESTYWINASVRIVPGFFLLMLSAYNLCLYFEEERKRNIVAALIAGFLSLWFYEQTVSLGFVLFCVIVYDYRRHPGWFALPVSYAGIFATYYLVFLQAGRMASRAAQAGLSFTTFRDIGVLLTREQWYNAFSLMRIDVPRVSIVIFILSILITIALTFLLKEDRRPKYNGLFSGMTALFLFIGAFGPFFVLKDSFLSLRSLYFCIPVVAMLAQWVWDRLSRFYFSAYVFFIVILECMLLGVASVNAFRVNYEDDKKIAGQIIEIVYTDGHPSDYDKVWLEGARYQFNAHGGVHLHSAALTDWSLSVLVNAYEMERFGKRHITPDRTYFMHPIRNGEMLPDAYNPARDLRLGVDENGEVARLQPVP